MESRREEQLRRKEQARARRTSETPEQREERLKKLDVLVRHWHEKRGKLGCHRWELMEADVLVKHEKREANLQQTSDDLRETRLEHEVFDQNFEVEDVTVKVPCRFDNTMNSAGSRRHYVGHRQLHHSTHDLPVTYAIYVSNQLTIHKHKFNFINANNLITQVFSKGFCYNRTLSPHSYSVILLQFTETSSNVATPQAAKTMPSPVASFTSLLDFH